MYTERRKAEPPLKAPFELPRNWPVIVNCGLDEGKLTGKARSKFISCVAGSIYMQKCYPTSEEYRHVGDAIIQKFPFLKSSNGYGYVC